MTTIHPGEHVRTLHDCWTGTDQQTRHDDPVRVTEVTDCTIGTRYRALRCDGTRIEWIADGTEVAA